MTTNVDLRRPLIIVTLLCLLSACQAFGPQPAWMKTELYFGLSRAEGGTVTSAQWQDFMTDEVTPRFPAGLSVLDADGQWQNASGKVVHERSKMLVLIHPADIASETAIETIRNRYRERFHQESVLKVTAPAQVEF